ncbi:hypothetical protein EMCRGX_G020603 [Ephydatia muelleri]
MPQGYLSRSQTKLWRCTSRTLFMQAYINPDHPERHGTSGIVCSHCLFPCEGNCNATIENLQVFTVALNGTAATEEVVGYGAIVSQYIQLVTQIQYGILLAVLRTSSGTVLCLVQGFDSL